MLAFAAFTPHPLVSIPEIGRDSISKIRQTVRSFRQLSYELYAAQPDTLILISPHVTPLIDAFTINQRPEFVVEFSKYGNLSDRIAFRNDLEFGYKIKESLETRIPVSLIDDEILDYGTGVTLFHLTRNLKIDKVRVVPIGISTLPLAQQYAFGTHINRQINLTTKRVAVIASGDLAHGASRTALTGYNPKAYAFNKYLRTALEQQDVQGILTTLTDNTSQIVQCGLKPLAVLLGALDQRRSHTKVLSYEAALGVGYLTAHFELK